MRRVSGRQVDLQTDADPQPMNSAYPLALRHSWPMWEQRARLPFDQIPDCAEAAAPAALSAPGLWEYHFVTGRLTWSVGVYDIFGLERGSEISREQALALYARDSRARVEQLRDYALRHKRGFTLDAEIRAAGTRELRQIRVIAAPVCAENRVVKLHGLKFLI